MCSCNNRDKGFNLFIIDKNKVDEVYNIIDETDISAYFLYEDAAKANILLYRKNELQQYLFQKKTGSL